MSDGNQFGRRTNRQPNDRETTQSWENEQEYRDPYAAPPPAQPTRRPAASGSQQPAPQYEDPNRYPPREPRRQSDPYASQQGDYDWSQADQRGAQWPDRPYADPQSGGQPAAYPSQRSSRRAPDDYEYGDEEIDDWENEQYRRGRSRPALPKISAPRLQMPEAVGAALAGQDSRQLIVAAGALLSLAAMAAVTANRVGAMDAWFPMHIDASGVADRWASPSTLWRLPLGLAMLTIMNVVSAVIVGARDRHIGWVLIGSLPLIHLLGWIALVLIGW